MAKTRFLVKFKDDVGSVTGEVITGYNFLNQMREFAFDGVRWFYQPKKEAAFIEVSGSEVPDNVIQSMMRITGRDEQSLRHGEQATG
jgi:hypothetical protein